MQRYMIEVRMCATRVCVCWQFFIALPVFWVVTRSCWGALVAFVSLALLALAHELGHATLARFCGRQVERIELHLLQGWCIFSKPEYEIEEIIVSWGGVLVQLGLFVAFELIYHGARSFHPEGVHLLNPIFAVFIGWNVISLIVNLLPIEGVDGATAWKIVPALRDGTFESYLRSKGYAFRLTRRARIRNS